MKSNPVKAALQAGQPQIGTWLTLGDLSVARLLARMGFAWLTVDLEHNAIDWQQAGALFGAIADAGCVPLARVPEGRHDYIKRVLDSGAHGIVVPMVETVEQARLCVAAAKYPPQGNRSVGGFAHAVSFNAAAGDYYRRANDEILVILQTESPLGVDNADAIYSVPGVDAIFVGPNDLQAQMRAPDGTEATPQQFEAMLQRVLATGKKHGTPVGIHTFSVEQVRQRIGEGWQFLAINSDTRMLLASAQQLVTQLGLGANAKEMAKY